MTRLPDRLVIASRGSRLALRQTEIVADLLRSVHSSLEIEIAAVTTRGDKDLRPYAEVGGKGLFTTEVEREVAEGRADIAVHSAKDLTAELGPGCAIVCVPPRGPVHDVVVSRAGSDQRGLEGFVDGARVGTSSLRRRALLAEARPDVDAVELRGNLDTRLERVGSGEIDGAILAAAGIERLSATTRVEVVSVDPGWWVPAPGQGALAIESRSDRADIAALLAPANDPAARAELAAERAFARRLEGGCSVPLGCLARHRDGRLVMMGLLADPEGTTIIRDRISGPAEDAEVIGMELAEAVLASGGRDILESLTDVPTPTVEEP